MVQAAAGTLWVLSSIPQLRCDTTARSQSNPPVCKVTKLARSMAVGSVSGVAKVPPKSPYRLLSADPDTLYSGDKPSFKEMLETIFFRTEEA